MHRRLVALFVLAAILFVPLLAAALPRPPGSTQVPSGTTETLKETLFVSAASGIVVSSQPLLTGRSYRVEVSGDYQTDTNGCHRGDMAYVTLDCWVNRSKAGGPSLVIDGVRQSNTLVAYKSNHIYCEPADGCTKVGEGRAVQFYIFDTNYGDNVGGLTVKIFAVTKVTWEFRVDRDLPGVVIDQTVTVPTTPQVGSIVMNHQPDGLWCITVTVGSTSRRVACTDDPGRQFPDQTIPIGGTNQTIRIQRTVIPAGSQLHVIFTWVADREHLYFFGSDFQTGSSLWLPWDYRNGAEYAWFLSQAANLGATIEFSVTDPSGAYVIPQTRVPVAGLGQILEALFESKAAGL